MSKIKLVVICLSLVLFSGCGGGGGSSSGANTTVPDATLSSIQSIIFTPRCALQACHGGTQSPLLISGAAWSSLVNQNSSAQQLEILVKPGESANSYIIKKLQGNPSIPGEQMPLSGSKLTQAQIDAIKTWIDAGALDD